MDVRNTITTWKVYVITDEAHGRGRPHAALARDAIEGGADVVQLRDKTASSLQLYKAALKIRQLTREAGVVFIMNDRLDIAMAADADGVHVGQYDMPAAVARQLLGQAKILGVSVGTLEEATEAEKDGADYLGVGPIFEARTTKSDARGPIGLGLLRDIRSACTTKVVAVGGVSHSNAAEVIRAGAHAVAVISAVVGAENVRKATRDLREIVAAEKIRTE